MMTLGADDLRALEQTRQRLLGLQTSLSALQQDLYSQQQLPSWSSLQSHSALVSSNVQAVAQQLSDQQHLLSSLAVHPLPQFPNHQGHIIEQMLRTKLEPEVEEWVEQGQELSQSRPTERALPDRDRNELWSWAPSAANAQARKQRWGADYTLAEKQMGIAHVETGLDRELVEPPDEAEDDDEDEYEEVTDDEEEDEGRMDVMEARTKPDGQGLALAVSNRATAAPQSSLESVNRFMVTGRLGP